MNPKLGCGVFVCLYFVHEFNHCTPKFKFPFLVPTFLVHNLEFGSIPDLELLMGRNSRVLSEVGFKKIQPIRFSYAFQFINKIRIMLI